VVSGKFETSLDKEDVLPEGDRGAEILIDMQINDSIVLISWGAARCVFRTSLSHSTLRCSGIRLKVGHVLCPAPDPRED